MKINEKTATLLRKIGNLARKRWFLTVEIYFATRFWGFLVQEVTRNSNQQGILYFVDKET